jgi:hypothetical protein
MAGYSARQSSFTTGDTILAAHSNDEFNQVLAAFHATTGHSHDGTAGEGGPVSTLRDADSLNKILVDTSNNHLEFYVEVSSAAVQQLRIQDGAIVPITDNDIDLGTSSLEFKDLYVDGTAYVDAINYNGTAISATAAELNIMDGVTSTTAELNILDGVTSTATELNIIDGDTSATSTTVADADRVVFNDNGTMVQVAVTDLAAYFDDEITAMPNLTSVGTLTTLTVDNIIINGTNIGHTSDTDAIAISSGGVVTFSQAPVFPDGSINIADIDLDGGTDVGGAIDDADLFLIDDGAGGTMRKATASRIKTYMGASAGEFSLTNLDIDGATDIGEAIVDADLFIVDNGAGGTNRKTTASRMKTYFTAGVSSAADDLTAGDAAVNLTTTSGNITIDAAAGDADIIFKGTDSSSDITAATFDMSDGGALILEGGVIDVKNRGSQSVVRFYCESSNAHYAQIQAPAHSAFSGNVTLTLPATTDTIAGIAASQTLTNKTLTTPIITEIDSGSTITLDATTDIVLDADGGDVFFKDDGTTIATLTNSSSDFVITTGVQDKDFIIKGDDGGSAITALTIDMSAAGAATFNDKITAVGTSVFTNLDISGDVDVDGTLETDALSIGSTTVTSTAAELNILDGVTSTATELNLLDGDTSVGGSITLADADGIVTNDGGTMKTIPASDIKTYVGAAAGAFSIANLDIDGGTDIGEDLVDADLFIVDNGAGGTNRKVAASRIKTYIGGGTQWQAVKTANYTASAGQGVFANTTSSAFTVTLPASPSIGDSVSIIDYAGTFDSNNLTVGRNGSKIQGATEDLTVATERAAFTLVFTDSTQGWLLQNN